VSGFYEPAPGGGSPFRERLLHPRWDLIEAALGRVTPGILRELYGEPTNVLRAHFRITPPDRKDPLWLDLFLPLDEEALRPYELTLPAGAIAFADDEHGDPYFYVPDATAYGDGPVYLLQHHQGGDVIVEVGPSLAAFLRWPRSHTY
jgi:hypothetical protein